MTDHTEDFDSEIAAAVAAAKADAQAWVNAGKPAPARPQWASEEAAPVSDQEWELAPDLDPADPHDQAKAWRAMSSR